jgi:S-adenosyl-L-methionine hydrolase (adenosine-forming)
MYSVITLTTDFGLSDPYAGVMKGVILGINPRAIIVDFTHQIEPQNILQAGLVVKNSYPYFSKGTIHVLVVDPGVGTERRIVSIQTDDQIFLAPDNGVLTVILEDLQKCRAYEISDTRFFLNKVSNTFHGRDIFAPVAGHLSAGRGLHEMGQPIHVQNLVQLAVSKPSLDGHLTISGSIVSIDHFGNLITNIDQNFFDHTYSEDVRNRLRFRIKDKIIQGISLNYQSVKIKKPLVLFDSNGFLEISVNSGNAAMYFQARSGDRVWIELQPE